jgi:chromosome segregation ATPase
VQVKEAEMLGNRVNDLEARLATQGKLLAERDFENNQLRQANEAAERTLKELRNEVDMTNSGKWPALDKLKTEKTALEEQLRVTRDERAKLQRDINTIQQQAESNWATERMENALLRERINDIAADVAKLAMQLEGPHSAIDAILGEQATAKVANGAAVAANGTAATPPQGGTLAERIRALQAHASRARQQGA